MPAAIDVATLPEELKNATSLFEMWQLTGLAQTAAAQNAGDLKGSVDNVSDAVTTGGKNAAAAINDVKEATVDLKTSVDNIKDAVTTGGHRSEAAIHDVRDATRELTLSVREVRTAISDGAERVAGAIYDLISELQQRGLIGNKGQPTGGAAVSVFREYEFFKVSASEGADDAMREHLGQLEKVVDEAIRAEKLATFLEHMRRWEDLGPSRTSKRPRRG
jgi:hypothetical protein